MQFIINLLKMLFGGGRKSAPNSSKGEGIKSPEVEPIGAAMEEAPIVPIGAAVEEAKIEPLGEEPVAKVEQVFPKFNLEDIKFHSDFPKDQYYQTEHPKNQVCLHHTVSGDGAEGDIRWWKKTAERVATSVIVERNGVLNQLFSTRHWGHHLGIKWLTFKNKKIAPIYRKNRSGKSYVANNEILNERSHGVEIDSWGSLKKINGQWRAFPNNYGTTGTPVIIPDDLVQEYPDGFRGAYGYEKYTKEQIDKTMSYLVYLHVVDGIPLTYNEDMWDISVRALSGESGIWSHTSYRSDKSDCHPQPELIEALKKLEKLTPEEIKLIYDKDS